MKSTLYTRLALALFLSLALSACGGASTPPQVEGPPALPPEAPEQPSFSWLLLADGVGATTWGTDVTALSGGDSDAIMVGGYIGTMTLGEGQPGEVTYTSVSWQDAYMTCVGASDGMLTWAVNLASSPDGWVVIQDVVETPTGIAIVGYFDDMLTFYDPSGAVDQVLNGDTVDDGFIAHYDFSGNLQWSRALTGAGYVECLAVGVRPDGMLLVAGLFGSQMSPGEELDTIFPSGNSDGFVATYQSSTGNFLWSRQFTSDNAGFVTPWSIECLDPVGLDIFVAGEFKGTADFGSNGDRTSVDDTVDAFLVRLDGGTGGLNWVRTIGGNGREQVLDLGASSDGATPHIRLTGGFEFTATFGEPGGNPIELTSAGGHDGFVAAINGDGSMDWAHAVGGPGEDYLSDAWVRGSDGALIAIGYFTGTCGFSNSPLTLVSHGVGDVDALLTGFAPDGSVDWAQAMGGEQDDYGLGISGIPGAQGDVYATGMISGTDVSFGPGATAVDVKGDAAGFLNRFLAK